MSITYKRELITPQRARVLLDSNSPNNRNPRNSKITQYARDMASGNWHANTGETIKISPEGLVLDGQNRLSAVVASKESIYFDMAYDVPAAAMQVIDSGAARSAADALQIAGAPERMVNSAVVRWAIMWDAGVYVGHSGGLRPTISEINVRYLKETDAFDAAARRGADCRRMGLGFPTPAGLAHYLFGRRNLEECKAFYDQLISGADLPAGSPVLTLSKRMVRSRVDRMKSAEQLALYIRAWNAFRDNKSMDRMMITRAGDLTNMNFPQPK